jgi:hypothetical protein
VHVFDVGEQKDVFGQSYEVAHVLGVQYPLIHSLPVTRQSEVTLQSVPCGTQLPFLHTGNEGFVQLLDVIHATQVPELLTNGLSAGQATQ